MKLSLILMVAVCLHVHATTYSQKITLSARDISLEKVFEILRSQSEYTFFYDHALLKHTKPVSVDIKNIPLRQALDLCLKEQPLTYSIIGKTVVLRARSKTVTRPEEAAVKGESRQTIPMPADLTPLSPSLLTLADVAPAETVGGKVTDEKGDALPGVSILVKGTQQGTTTGTDGTFQIEVPDEKAVLVFSFVGYVTRETVVGNKSTIAISMETDNKALEEVVVVGYGTQRRKNLTGSVSTIRSEDIVIAPTANVTNTLVGKLPGLIVKQTSGQPGSDAGTLNIRGFGSPLVIVDGVEASLSNLDPEQIESISVLKDGSASIYGARAGNGVLLVTTKRGTNQKPVISFQSSYTLQGVTRMVRPANSGQRAQMEREAYLQSGKPEEGVPWSREDVRKFFEGGDPAYPNTDWHGQIFRTWAPQRNHNLSVRGGNERIRYMGYFGYLDQETIIKKNGGDFRRYNIQSNVDATITQNLSLAVDLLVAYENREFTNRGIGQGGDMWQDLYNTLPWFPASLPDPTKISYGGLDIGSVIATSDINIAGYNRSNGRDLRGAVALTYDIPLLTGLKAKALVSYRDNETYVKNFRKPYSFYTYNTATGTYTLAGNYYTKARLNEAISRGHILTQQYSLNYENTLGKKHWLSVLALFESMDYGNNAFDAFRGDFLTPLIEQLSVGSTTGMSNNGSASEMGRASFIGRVNYGFKDRYLLESIVRADASAKFAKGHQWGYFPSVSFGWILSKEPFMEGNNFIDNLKIRTSYGQSGNDGVANFRYLTGYQLKGSGYLMGDESYRGIYSTAMANPLLTWEKMTVYNGGVDFSFLNRKVYGTAEAFYRLREGIPATRLSSLPSTFGAQLPEENINSLNDRGFELSLGTTNRAGNFTYDISGNISWSQAKYVHFEEPEYEDPDQDRIYRRSGQRTDRRMGYKSDGLFTSMEEIEQLAYNYEELGGGNQSLRPGDIKFLDTNEDGVLNWKDMAEIGRGSMPHWIYGTTLAFTYKNVDLTAHFQGAFGYSTDMNFGYRTSMVYRLRWEEENNNPDALVTRLGGASSNSWASDFTFRTVSYARLRSFSVGYTIPKSIVGKIGAESLRIYLAGTNLLTLSNLSKYRIDPEAPDGEKAAYYPQQRTLSAGVKLSF